MASIVLPKMGGAVGTGASWSTRVPGNFDLIGPTKQNDGNYIYPCMTVFGDTVADGDFYATLPAGVYCVAGFGLGLATGKYHIAKKGALSVSLCSCDYSYGSTTNVFTGKQTFTLSEDTTVAFVSLAGYSEGACVMVTRVE